MPVGLRSRKQAAQISGAAVQRKVQSVEHALPAENVTVGIDLADRARRRCVADLEYVAIGQIKREQYRISRSRTGGAGELHLLIAGRCENDDFEHALVEGKGLAVDSAVICSPISVATIGFLTFFLVTHAGAETP